MPVQILMPALSPTMTEGKLAKWAVKVGDSVESGDVIAEIETDKATMEVEAVDEGKIAKILVEAGTEGVAVNEVIAVLLEDDEDESDLSALDTPVQPKAPAPVETPKAEESPAVPSVVSPKASPVQTDAKTGTRIFASPLAKRIAKNENIDLSALQGSGPRGRIVKADVEQAIKTGVGTPTAATAPTVSTASSAMPKGIDAKAMADAMGRSYETLPANGVRKVIADRLLEAKQTIPHFYLTVDCELDALLALRKQVNEEGDGEYKVSVNDFIIRATAKALRDVPAANASWAGDAILQYNDVDVSVAVASDNGLITPIVKNADQKALTTISNEMKDLAGRARDGKLKPEEFQGGGFTISNLGMFGIKVFSAIINPPQSCILAVGAGEQRPVVKDGQLAIATVMSVTLSSDHRSVDGAVGAEFLAAFKKYIENPAKILV